MRGLDPRIQAESTVATYNRRCLDGRFKPGHDA